MERVDCLVVGAGVIGLAVARAFARAGRRWWCWSGGVIGPGSVRATARWSTRESITRGLAQDAAVCPGRGDALRILPEHDVPDRRCGKLVVATDEAKSTNSRRSNSGTANGAAPRVAVGHEAYGLEPALRPSARSCRLRPASSTVTHSWWRCSAKRKRPARWSQWRRRSDRSGGIRRRRTRDAVATHAC